MVILLVWLFSEDGYHEEGSYKIVDAPKEASDELA